MADAAAEARSEAARALTRPQEENSKFDHGDCDLLGKASIKCIEEHGYNRSDPACQPHYDAYKECRRLETAKRRALAGGKSLFG